MTRKEMVKTLQQAGHSIQPVKPENGWAKKVYRCVQCHNYFALDFADRLFISCVNFTPLLTVTFAQPYDSEITCSQQIIKDIIK